MSGGQACSCARSLRGAERRSTWRVYQRNGNASAFNGGRWTSSDFSAVLCTACGARWRTRAKYVPLLKDATREERNTVGNEPRR
jgi:hypothetical protein